ncbi:MAG TPA: hypothetical protein VJT82_12220 [Pyrinomonadaceae bacterium]|nr:hypothetical protein [Pyrinomonadaceae bacterium]
MRKFFIVLSLLFALTFSGLAFAQNTNSDDMTHMHGNMSGHMHGHKSRHRKHRKHRKHRRGHRHTNTNMNSNQ